MIYIVSPCRSGSGWLTTALFCLGYDVCHELFSYGVHGETPSGKFVWSDTTLIFKKEQLKQEATDKDFIIFLSRDSKDILDSLATLLPGYSSEACIDAYRAAIDDWFSYAAPCLWIHYTDLFKSVTAAEIATFLGEKESEFIRVWTYLKDFRITNKTNEEAVRKLYEEQAGKGKEGYYL